LPRAQALCVLHRVLSPTESSRYHIYEHLACAAHVREALSRKTADEEWLQDQCRSPLHHQFDLQEELGLAGSQENLCLAEFNALARTLARQS
jgi:hypothetical protein